MSSRPPFFGRRAEGLFAFVGPHRSMLASVAVLLGLLVCFAIALATPSAASGASHPVRNGTGGVVQIAPAQGEEMFTFISCTAPDGSNCTSPYGGLITPLEVGTTVEMMFFSDALDSTPITGSVNWGDGSPVQYYTDSYGDCQCSFGPFTHTYNSAGTFTIVISDGQDGPESLPAITVSATAAIFSLDGFLIMLGALLGLGAMVGALASLRGPRVSASASLPPPPVPTPVTTGYITNSPAGVPGVTAPSTWNIPPASGAPPGGYPSWAYDYRTTPYQPNPLIQGWPGLLQKFQMEHATHPPAPPNWPHMTNPAPPTSWPGTFYQARINPQSGQWAWWNPIDGTFL